MRNGWVALQCWYCVSVWKESKMPILSDVDFHMRITGHSLEYKDSRLYKYFGYLHIACLWILFVPIVRSFFYHSFDIKWFFAFSKSNFYCLSGQLHNRQLIRSIKNYRRCIIFVMQHNGHLQVHRHLPKTKRSSQTHRWPSKGQHFGSTRKIPSRR